MAAQTAVKPTLNGGSKTNGYFSPPSTPSSPLRYKPSISGGGNKRFSLNMGSAGKTGIVRDTAVSLKRKSASELGAGISETADKVGYLDLVEWIRSERLSTLPHKGSKWDTVLIRALFFAERLHGFETALKGHALDIEPAAQLGYGHTRLLLELGHENSEALDKAFGFLYRCSASVAGLLARSQVLQLSSEIYEQLCVMYSDLLTLVVDVAVKFYKAVHSHSDNTASLDLFAVFGDTITTFRERKDSITKAIWDRAIQSDNSDIDEAIETTVLSRWLAPQDRVLATLELDHTLIADSMVEMTCVWFHDELAKFVRSSDHSLLINGREGSGKTTLACALAERLLRPIAKKSYAMVFYSVGAVPSQATTLNVVKAILHQLLAIRVGNMHMYHAIAQAYDKARFTADAGQYEELLWHALEDVLRHPLANNQDTVIIVEGLDELIGGSQAGQALLQRLVHVSGHGKGVKFIGLAQNLKLPSGVHGIQRDITWHNDTKDDLHEVSIKKLARIHHFRTKTGRDQEGIISHIIEQSQGSFLWVSLTCDLLQTEPSADAFNNAVKNISQNTTIDQLTQRLLTVLQPNDDAKLLLSWLVNAARPLTYREIEALFSVNGQTATRAERRVDVHQIVQSLLPLLGLEEDIVRIKHSLVQRAVVDLLKKGSFTPSSVKDTQMDLLLRILTYAKVSIQEKGEPTLDSDDRNPVDHFFNHHVLLEYVIRYYTWHLGQTSVAVRGKPTDVKITPEIQRAFPDSTVMPVLEWLCWDDQFPGAQEVEFHEIVQNLRIKIFTQKHPSVLQSYINTACYYEMMQNVTKSGHLYYLIATVGRDVLSLLHPVVVECSLRFLRITHTSVTTTRTETMTYREHILILLISAYERQYGVNSEIVTKTREQLIELYMSLNEHEKAQEILIILQGNTGAHGKLSKETRDMEETLRVSLGKHRDREVGSYDHGIFEEEEDVEEAVGVLDLKEVEVILRQIETLISKKEFVRAEETYVQLWQRLSVSCRSTLSVEWHAKKIEVVQKYASFLETHQRRAESTSLLISIWREYEHHEVAFSEIIVSKLTQTARHLQTVGEYSASLAIFKHASSYYRNVRKEDSSRSLAEIEEEMTVVSSQAFKHSSTEIAKSSESAQWDMFHVLINNHSRSVDQTTLTMAKSLTSQYIERREWSKAISVIETTLKRTWSSFLSKSVHEVTLTTTFQKESIEMVEQLAQIYISQRSFEKAEDVYIRLFRASLTSTKDQSLLEKTKGLILGFYLKRGHSDKVISIYQELLAVYRRILGPSHETTISILYELATRCRAHARSHPYWVEYYQQIVTVLNGDSKTCHPRAFEAAIIVAESYWEERRYSDAVATYSVIWNTYTQKHKEFKAFSEATFVRNIYERYYQSLEETKADYQVLSAVTKEYRETTRATFGASSAIAIEATVALARVYQQSSSHFDESVSLYEEASQSISKSSEKSSIHIDTSELQQTLTTIYKRRILHSAESKSVSQETVSRAVDIYQSQYEANRKSLSFSHESTLSSLRELCQLYSKQSKTEQINKELTTAVVEIVNKETSSQKCFEAATSIVQTYQATGMVQQCTQLVDELHYQLITREKSSKASFSVVESSSSALVFLAVMQYHIRKDLSITLSEIMASIKAESIMWHQFNLLVGKKAGLDQIITAAAPLRFLLRQNNRSILVSVVEQKAVHSFTQGEAADVQLLAKDSPHVFVVGILDYLASRRTADFVRSLVIASNSTLAKLIEKNDFTHAYDVAKLSFVYAQHRKGYRHPKSISRGFALASYLDGRGENRCPDPELRKKLLQLSNTIIKDILKTCKELKINLVQVQLKELNELIALLGEQQDYDTLESLLNELWTTRDAQRTWSSDVLLNLGRRLICARYLAGRQIKALRLAEDIAYNLRRVNGIHSQSTIEAYELLAQLYTRTGQYYQAEAANDKSAAHQASEHFKKAVVIHEDILRWLLHDPTSADAEGDDDDDDTASTILAQHGKDVSSATGLHAALTPAQRAQLAQRHLHLLKMSFQRLGAWPKSYGFYEKLNADLFKTFPDQLKSAEGVEKWNAKGFGAGKAESNEGVFTGSKTWEILNV